jgi:hypothetical protein
MEIAQKKVAVIKKKYENEWLHLKGVSSVGIGLVNDTVGIIISVEGFEDRVRAQVPSEIEGIPIKIETSGAIRAL